MDLLNNTLDSFKLARGEMEFEHIEFDLWDLLGKVADHLYGYAGNRELSLKIRVAPNTPRTWKGDALRIKQMITNLINNATKFTTDGEIVLSIGQSACKGLTIEVRDTGMGIPSQSLDKLFSENSQDSTATARLYGGSGLGLNLVKKLVEHFGGSMSLQSEEGIGTCVNLLLPLPALATRAPARQLPMPSIELSNSSHQHELTDTLMAIGCEGEPSPDWTITDNYQHAIKQARLDPKRKFLVTPHANGLSRQVNNEPSTNAVLCVQGPLHPKVVLNWFYNHTRTFATFKESSRLAKRDHAIAMEPSSADSATEDDDKLWVLIAEDVAMSRIVMREVLKKRGVHCLEAENGQVAVQQMLQHGKRIDFVFMDINMPVMNGRDATAAIREHDQLKDLKIYALTGEDEQNTDECKDWSIFDHVFKKPMRFDKLEELLERHRGG